MYFTPFPPLHTPGNPALHFAASRNYKQDRHPVPPQPPGGPISRRTALQGLGAAGLLGWLGWDFKRGKDQDRRISDLTSELHKTKASLAQARALQIHPAIVDASAQCTVMIQDQERGKTGWGCFFKDDFGNLFILTNEHVAAAPLPIPPRHPTGTGKNQQNNPPAPRFVITPYNGQRQPGPSVWAELVKLTNNQWASDKEKDLSVLRIESGSAFSPSSFVSPSLFRDIKRNPVINEPIFIVGAPAAQRDNVNRGSVAHGDREISSSPGDGHALQLDAACNPGNSGGPVFDRNGKVIAVVQAVPSNTDGTRVDNGCLAIRIDTVLKWLGSIGIPITPG